MGAAQQNIAAKWTEANGTNPKVFRGLSLAQAPAGGSPSHVWEEIGEADHDDLITYADADNVSAFEALIATTPAASLYAGLSTAEKEAARLAFAILK